MWYKNLDKKYGWLAKKSLVFPNFIDIAHWLKEYKENTTDRVRILWAGSTSHKTDLKQFRPVMKAILEKYKDKVQFIYVGMGGIQSKDPQAQFFYGEDFWKGFPNNRESLLPVPAFVWPYTLSSIQADIALAPLRKDYFNRFKSQCKFLEYSINKIPAVYSRWFYDEVMPSYTGLTADSTEEWISRISYLIENPHKRKEIGKKAYNYVINYHNIKDYLKDYEYFLLNL